MLLISLIFIAIAAIPAGAVKIIKVNPINLAVIIAEKTDTARIQSEFDYYGYTLQGTEDGYKIMKSPQGSEIRYSLRPSLSPYPTVIVKNEEDTESLEKRLKNLSFQKEGNDYTRVADRADNHLLHCTTGPSNTLIFHCQKK